MPPMVDVGVGHRIGSLGQGSLQPRVKRHTEVACSGPSILSILVACLTSINFDDTGSLEAVVARILSFTTLSIEDGTT